MTVIGAMQWLLLCSMSQLCYAQSDHLHFEHVSPHRLPHSLVWSIYQDQEGFMWFGTYRGLVKYDGTTTTVWKTDSTDRNQSLLSNRIFDMHDDRHGSLWFPTEGGGLHELDKRTGQVKVYPVDSLQASRWDVAKSIFEDRQGRFLLSCGLGIALFDPVNKQYTLFPAPDEQMIDFMQQDSQDKLWGVNQEGLWQFDPKTSQYKLLPLLTASNSQLATNSLHIDAQGVAWVGTNGNGIFQVDTREKRPIAVAYQQDVINKHINRHGLYATNDYLWVATNHGLQHIHKKTDQVDTYTADPSKPGSLSNDNIISIYQDRMGNLWIGMWLGVNKASLLPKTFFTHQVLPTPEPFHREENMITSILEDHTGLVWVVSAAGGLYQFNPFTHGFTHVVVNPAHRHQDSPKYWRLLEDKEGRLWVGCGYTDKALYLYNRIRPVK